MDGVATEGARDDAGPGGGDLASRFEALSGEFDQLRAEVVQRDRALTDRVLDRLTALTAQVDGLRTELSR